MSGQKDFDRPLSAFAKSLERVVSCRWHAAVIGQLRTVRADLKIARKQTSVTLAEAPISNLAKVRRHRTTSFASSRTDSGIVRPRDLAVLRLITSSYSVGCSTGRSAGLAPLRILSTQCTALANRMRVLVP